jgi:hypothetical protein
MSDSVLTVLKFCLLALLYLFLARVVWIVAKELRGSPEPVPAAPRAASAPPAKSAKKRDWRLVVNEPKSERGQSFTITADSTIGRGGGCTVPITFDTFASQVHAKASPRDGDLWIEDIGSTNGTIVNGKRIEHPVKLRKGDKVKVGETTFVVDR